MLEKIKSIFANLKAKKEAKKYKVDSTPLDPKAAATARKEPWVGVLDMQVNVDNPRNGFFELDWNEYHVMMLTQNGYRGTTEEEIVDQWFQDLCREIGEEEGLPMDRRGMGYININKLPNGKTEIS